MAFGVEVKHVETSISLQTLQTCRCAPFIGDFVALNSSFQIRMLILLGFGAQLLLINSECDLGAMVPRKVETPTQVPSSVTAMLPSASDCND